jgi:hypothetical protein
VNSIVYLVENLSFVSKLHIKMLQIGYMLLKEKEQCVMKESRFLWKSLATDSFLSINMKRDLSCYGIHFLQIHIYSVSLKLMLLQHPVVKTKCRESKMMNIPFVIKYLFMRIILLQNHGSATEF